ncbi:MAG: helix-turn-helix domain-containing protein [Pseudomonas sp.]
MAARDLVGYGGCPGLERAKSEGKALGRPAATSVEQVQSLKAEGKSQSEVAAQLEVSLSTVKRLWNKAG